MDGKIYGGTILMLVRISWKVKQKEAIKKSEMETIHHSCSNKNTYKPLFTNIIMI